MEACLHHAAPSNHYVPLACPHLTHQAHSEEAQKAVCGAGGVPFAFRQPVQSWQTASASCAAFLRTRVPAATRPVVSTLVQRFQRGVHSILQSQMSATTAVTVCCRECVCVCVTMLADLCPPEHFSWKQIAAWLSTLAECRGIWGPFLIICPAASARLWQSTIEAVCPQLFVMPYWNDKKDRQHLRR